MPDCDEYGFFNGHFGLEQANWAKYWNGIIPDGVIAGVGNEMAVVTDAQGTARTSVQVGTGEAMLDNHKAWITSAKEVDMGAIGSKGRIDIVVLRCVYGNSGESKMDVTYIQGTAAASPVAPSVPTNVTGGVCYLPLAQVTHSANETQVSASNIKDLRYVYSIPNNKINTFSGSSLTPLNDREYRCSSALTSLTINLPANPHDTFITSVCYTTHSTNSFTIVFQKGGSTFSNYKLVGDTLTMKGKRYNLVIWWDSSAYWVAAKGM